MNLQEFEQTYFHNGIPNKSLTASLWQEYFIELKNQLPIDIDAPYPQTERSDEFQYGDFIYDVLDMLREGEERDYCYYNYQVKDLLKFEPRRLRTKYIPEYQCIEVWLTNNEGKTINQDILAARMNQLAL